jgi:hypothetical protein
MSKPKIVPRDNRGRKPLPPGKARRRWIGSAVTDLEKETFRMHATEAGFASESEYLRDLAGFPSA